MFKAFFNFLEKYNPKNESLEDYFNRTGDKDLNTFYVENNQNLETELMEYFD